MRFPRNEEEVIELYKLAQYRLGWPIIHLQRKCPDAIVAKNGHQLRAEFEHKARNFKAHGHDPGDCDLIICWHNNWPDAPLPWPLKLEKYPEHWPEAIGRYWLQAKRNIRDENWEAAAVMARSALQIALRDQKAKGKNLKQEIDDLASRGMLPPIMKDWSDHVRELGNESAHPNPDQGPTNPQDARDIVSFLDFLLEYLYSLPHQIQLYRERAKE